MNRINYISDRVILVDNNDQEVGVMPKLEAHQKGLLHRAFSVFLFNSKGQLLLQQRAAEKYHSAGLWSNTCCSHPLPGEPTEDAATRKLLQEMGIKADLKPVFNFTYKVKVENELMEHEYDHVFFGNFDGLPVMNPDEVQNWKYISLKDLELQMILHPENYTEWLKLCFNQVMRHFNNQKKGWAA